MAGEEGQIDTAAQTENETAQIPSESPVEAVESKDSITQIFNREDTKAVLVEVIVFSALAGIAIGVLGYLVTGQAVDGDAGFAFADEEVVVAAVLLATVVLGPVLAVVLSLRANGLLSSVRDDFAIATAAVGSGVGVLTLLVLVTLLSTVPTDDAAIGDFAVVFIVGAVVAGVLGGASVWFGRRG